MREIFVITNNNYKLEDFIKVLTDNLSEIDIKYFNDCVEIYSKENNTERVQIEIDNQILQYYEEQEIKIINEKFTNPKVFCFYFKDIRFIKKIILNFDIMCDFLIDNDNGLITNYTNFVKKVKENPDWDWAYD